MVTVIADIESYPGATETFRSRMGLLLNETSGSVFPQKMHLPFSMYFMLLLGLQIKYN